MKNYLNKQEKMDYAQLAATMAATANIRERWAEHGNLTKEEHKYLKMAESFITKAMSSVLERMPLDQHIQLLRVAKSTQCVCVPEENQATFKKHLMEEMEDEDVLIKQDALDELAEMALVRCCTDCAHKENQKDCPCRYIFLELDIPPYDSQAKGCPWEMTEKEAV